MRHYRRTIGCLAGCALLLVVFYASYVRVVDSSLLSIPDQAAGRGLFGVDTSPAPVSAPPPEPRRLHVWAVFAKAQDSFAPIKYKLRTMLVSLLTLSSGEVQLNLVTDKKSEAIAREVVDHAVNVTNKRMNVVYYDVTSVTRKMDDVVKAMKPHFTSQPGSYYSDSLFFISVALHRVAPPDQGRVVLLDVDTKLATDVALLFDEFDNFSNSSLIGICPEMSPVYHHVLYNWRALHKRTAFGSPRSKGGFPGLNSGVLMLDLDRLRGSALYGSLLGKEALDNLTAKYLFKGHLGDQDFYTLVAFDMPHLFHVLDCGWNRQLCTWWREHGYRDAFDAFHSCPSPVKIYHGNCNTPIPG